MNLGYLRERIYEIEKDLSDKLMRLERDSGGAYCSQLSVKRSDTTGQILGVVIKMEVGFYDK